MPQDLQYDTTIQGLFCQEGQPIHLFLLSHQTRSQFFSDFDEFLKSFFISLYVSIALILLFAIGTKIDLLDSLLTNEKYSFALDKSHNVDEYI